MTLPQRANLKGLGVGLTAKEMAGAINDYLTNLLVPHPQYSPTFDLKGEIKRTPDGGITFTISSQYLPRNYQGSFHPGLIEEKEGETSPEEYRNNVVSELITELRKINKNYTPSLRVEQNPLEFTISIPRPQRTERPSSSLLARPVIPQTMTPLKEPPKS